MKVFLWLLRIVVGGLFIFSGLVKANDPLGLSYKMDEFFEVWNWQGFRSWSLILSIIMIGFEIIAGGALLLGYAQRFFAPLLLALITFFTFLTAYVLFSGKIKECGCFGDCIKISNTETFWKDVALLVMAIVLYIFRKRVTPIIRTPFSTALMLLTAFFAFGIQVWALEHLPFHDCLPYKKGVNLFQGTKPPPGSTPDVYETVLVYQKDGVKKEFNETNFPWEDSTWTYVDTRTKLVKEGNATPAIKDFSLTDAEGNDHTEEVLTAPAYGLLWFVKDVDKARTDNLDRLQTLAAEVRKSGGGVYMLSSSTKVATEQFVAAQKLQAFDVLYVDGTASKTALRSNPGLMILKDGVVQGKYSFRDYPASLTQVK
ncbi:MAG: DoxX family protein [Sphingobacteriales bacterium]|nr:MAG: DoxX family protein [Sphingobacteriales bacterium]